MEQTIANEQQVITLKFGVLLRLKYFSNSSLDLSFGYDLHVVNL